MPFICTSSLHLPNSPVQGTSCSPFHYTLHHLQEYSGGFRVTKFNHVLCYLDTFLHCFQKHTQSSKELTVHLFSYAFPISLIRYFNFQFLTLPHNGFDFSHVSCIFLFYLPCKPVDDSEEESCPAPLPRCYPYGNLNVDDLVQRLAQAGLTDARVEERPGEYIITLVGPSIDLVGRRDCTLLFVDVKYCVLNKKLVVRNFECLSS